MSLTIDHTWISSTLTLGNRAVDAYRREGGDISHDYPFIAAHFRTVVSEGGLLFRHERDWKVIGESVDPFGNKSYQLAPTGTDVWYVPQGSFPDSLELLDSFGFPNSQVCLRPEEVRRLTKDLLLDLSTKRPVALLSITSDSLYLERVGSGAEFTTEEITRVIDFNREHFAVKHSKSFLRNLRKGYRQKGFFVLGKG